MKNFKTNTSYIIKYQLICICLVFNGCQNKRTNQNEGLEQSKKNELVIVKKLENEPKLFSNFWSKMSKEEYQYVNSKLIIEKSLYTKEDDILYYKMFLGDGHNYHEFFLTTDFDSLSNLNSITLNLVGSELNDNAFSEIHYSPKHIVNIDLNQLLKIYSQKYGKYSHSTYKAFETCKTCNINDLYRFLDNKNNNSIEILVENGYSYRFTNKKAYEIQVLNKYIAGLKIRYMDTNAYTEKREQEIKDKGKITNIKKETFQKTLEDI